MRDYVSPNAEVITFTSEKIIAASGCNCHFDIEQQNMGVDYVCKAMSGHASENPFGISAPDWQFGN